jgi:excisionase family DNA binding protein
MNNQILVSIPLNEFEKLQKDWIREVLSENKPPTPKPDEKYLTRQETAKILQVTLPTLSDWVKRGKIRAYKINTRIRFKKSDIENALNEVVKYKRRTL